MFTCCSVPFPTETGLTEHLWSPYLHTQGPHRCFTCGASFPSTSGLYQHHREGFHLSPSITAWAPFRCTVCGLDYQDRSALDQHMDTVVHHIPCHWCDLVCNSRLRYDVHLIRNHTDLVKRHPETIYAEALVQNPVVSKLLLCGDCSAEFCFQETWEAHMASSHPDLPRPSTIAPTLNFYCTTCTRGFFFQRAFDQHCASTHPPVAPGDGQTPARPPVSCPICRGLFYTQQAVDLHHTDVHQLPPRPARRRKPVRHAQISCAECGGVFASQGALGQHTVAMHSFTPPAHAQAHVVTHRGPVNFHICARQFLSAKAVEQHISAVHPAVPRGRRPNPPALASIPCPKCSAFFQTHLALSQHTSSAHAAAPRTRTPIAQFTCSICSKVFQSEYAVDQHMVSAAHPEFVQKGRRRRDAPVYQCEECPRMFEAKDMLTLHAAEHVSQRLRLG